MFDRHEVLGELGRGGMGVVYRARGPDGREVALKVLLERGADRLARFERERRLLGQFTARDGFVPLLEAGTSEQGPYIVMPLLGGGSLRARLARGPMPVADVIALGQALADALAHAHAHGVVHRDLKPENILFDEDRPLVADLGLAKHFDRNAPGASQSVSISQQGSLRGTAGYMAPEQMEDAASVGPAADVFALGAILYECLAGTPAFADENMLGVFTRIAESRFPPLARVRPDAPRPLAAVIERALATQPAKRYQDARELGLAWRAASGAAPVRGGRLVAASLGLLGVLAGAFFLARPAAGSKTSPVAAPPPRPPASVTETGRKTDEARMADARALLTSADMKRGAGDLDGAIAACTKAIELAPRFAGAWVKRGDTKTKKSDWAGAIEDATRAIELDPSIPGAWDVRGFARMSQGVDLDGAIADCTRALDVAPGVCETWATRGWAKRKKLDHTGAIADLERAVQIQPAHTAVWLGLGQEKARVNDIDGAIEAFRAFLARVPSGPESDGARAEIERLEARRGAVTEPRTSADFAVRAAGRSRRNDQEGALADYARALELDPKNLTALIQRVWLRARRADYDGCIEDSTAALAVDPSSMQAWHHRGFAKVSRKEFQAGISDLDRAIELDPNFGSSWLTRAHAREQLGDLEGALADFERGSEVGPKNDMRGPTLRVKIEELKAKLGR